jgi:hypothetical protein
MELLSNLNHFDKKRPYTSRKLDPKIDIEGVEKIGDYFNNPDKYLELSNNIIVGKLVKGPRFDDMNKPIPFTYVGQKDQFNEDRKNDRRERSSILQPSHASMFLRNNIKKRTERLFKAPVNYEIIDERRVNFLFDNARQRVMSNTGKLNEFIDKNEKIKSMTRERFYQQEKILSINETERCKTAELTTKVANRLNKKDDELLMHRSDAFNTKKQIKDIIENGKDSVEKWGNNHWLIDLKRPKILSRVRTAYINVAPGKNSEKFDILNDYPKKPVELIHRPNSTGLENVGLFGKEFAGAMRKNNINLDHMKTMSMLGLEGKSLLEEELKRAKMTTGKKYLYKEPYNGKIDEVFKENYDDKIYLKNRLFGLK